MKRLLIAAFAAAVIGVASPVRAQDTKDSKDAAAGWKLAKGDKARYVYSYEFERAIEAMGMQIPQTTKLTLHLHEEVTDVTGGVATISAKIGRVIVEADLGPMGGGAMNFDSADAPKDAKDDKKPAKNQTPNLKGDDDDDDDKPAKKKAKKDDDDDDDDDANPLAALQFAKGKSFTFKVAADGSVSDLDGLDEICMKVAQKGHVGEGLQMPRQGDMAGAQRMMKKMALPTVLVLFSKDVVQQTLDLHCHLFVAGSADSWKIDTTEQFPTMGNITFTRSIAAKGEAEAGGDKGTKFEQTATEPKFKPMAVPPGMGGGMGGMAAMLGKLKMKGGSFKGWSVFSKDKGRLLGDELVQKATFEGSMPNPLAPQGRKNKKKAADDDDDDDDAKPKTKDDGAKKDDSKKDDSKKDDSKKGDDADDDDDAGGMKLVQKVTLRLKYGVLVEDAAKKPEDKKPDEKKPDEKKKDKDF